MPLQCILVILFHPYPAQNLAMLTGSFSIYHFLAVLAICCCSKADLRNFRSIAFFRMGNLTSVANYTCQFEGEENSLDHPQSVRTSFEVLFDFRAYA